MLFEKIMYFTAYKIVICGKQKQISLRSFSTSNGLHVFSSFSSATFDYAVLSVMDILWSIPLRTRSIIPCDQCCSSYPRPFEYDVPCQHTHSNYLHRVVRTPKPRSLPIPSWSQATAIAVYTQGSSVDDHSICPRLRTTVLDEGNCDNLGEDRVIKKLGLMRASLRTGFFIVLFCFVGLSMSHSDGRLIKAVLVSYGTQFRKTDSQISRHYCRIFLIERHFREFPVGPVVRTPCFPCRGQRFDPWLEE